MKAYLAEVEPLPEGFTYPFKAGDIVLIFEIEQTPGHVAAVLPDGRTVYGYDDCNFRKLSKDEA